jgi:Ser/Thr protein kinase RdoA (MazF antagonist)
VASSPEITVARRMAEVFVGRATAVEGFGAGHINETYLVESAAGEYVLQRVNTAVFTRPDAITANIVVVHRHLRGALMPEPVATPAGEWLVWEGGAPWRAWRRLPGRPLASGEATPAALQDAATLLGRFHGLVADLDPGALTETLPGFHDPGRRLEALRTVVAADPCGRVATVQDEIQMALEAQPLVDAATDLTRRVPLRVAHYDAKLDNFLFVGDDAVALVDFDTVMPGAWFWDLGDLLRSGATVAAEDEPNAEKVAVVPERYHSIIAGYRQSVSAAGTADESELEAIGLAGAIVTYEQSVRFLTDWIAGDVYYRISRPAQNLDRARAQFRLLASMPRP